QAEDGIRDRNVTGVQTCALPISHGALLSLGAGPASLSVDRRQGVQRKTAATALVPRAPKSATTRWEAPNVVPMSAAVRALSRSSSAMTPSTVAIRAMTIGGSESRNGIVR